MDHAEINFRLRSALQVARAALVEGAGPELDPGLGGVIALIDESLALQHVPDPTRYSPTPPGGPPPTSSIQRAEAAGGRGHRVRFVGNPVVEPSAVDALRTGIVERNMSATEVELRRLLLEMRETGDFRRYVLVGYPDIGPMVHHEDGVCRFEMSWPMGAVDEIPANFSGQVFELTPEALSRAFAAIDSGAA